MEIADSDKPRIPKVSPFDVMNSNNPSQLARTLKSHGITWQDEFAKAIKNRDPKLMSFWARLVPYLVTKGTRKGRPQTRGRRLVGGGNALEKLEEMEGRKDA